MGVGGGAQSSANIYLSQEWMSQVFQLLSCLSPCSHRDTGGFMCSPSGWLGFQSTAKNKEKEQRKQRFDEVWPERQEKQNDCLNWRLFGLDWTFPNMKKMAGVWAVNKRNGAERDETLPYCHCAALHMTPANLTAKSICTRCFLWNSKVILQPERDTEDIAKGLHVSEGGRDPASALFRTFLEVF